MIDTSRQKQMNFAIKQVEETLAANNNKMELTGLEKWQLAVKYVAMRRNPEAVNFLGRYGAQKELKLPVQNMKEIKKQE